MNRVDRNRRGFGARTAFSGLLALVFCYLVMFVQLPYYVFEPGTAEDISGMVSIGDGGFPESGTLLLTTVGVSRSNILKLLQAELRSYEIKKITDVRKAGETNQEYDERQRYIMLTSQSNAVQAAYNKAGVPYHIANAGVMVMRTLPGYPAYGILEAGDTIVRVDGNMVWSGTELSKAFAGKKAGDTVMVEYRHKNVGMEAAFTLKPIPKNTGDTEEKLGIGAATADLQRIQAGQPGKAITIEAGEIGGPSAGFMFAMEIYARLLPEDLTKGYTIAGTGTIEPDGRIGVIGGIKYKVAAAARVGADLFFAPKDWRPVTEDSEGEEPVLNATEAENQAKKLRTGMKIVPVGSLEEAVAYMEKLPPKSSAPGK